MKEKVEAEWHPTDKSHSRTDDAWKRIMVEPYVTEREEDGDFLNKCSKVRL